MMDISIINKSFSSTWLSLLIISCSFLFQNVKIISITLWKCDHWLFGSNNENIASSGSKSFTIWIFQVNNIEWSEMTFNMNNLTNSSDVVTSCHISKMTGLTTDPFNNLIFLKIKFNSISFINLWVRESDSSWVIGNNVRNFVWSNSFWLNF